MLSFHNDQAVKDKYLNRIRAHQVADNLTRRIGWENGKGCAVGCTLENYDHSRYPIELGLPEWLARLEDALFEGMSLEKSKTFPEKFLEVIPVGVELESVKWKFFVFIMGDCRKTVEPLKISDTLKDQVLNSIDGVRDLYLKAVEQGKVPADAAAAWRADAAWRAAAAWRADVTWRAAAAWRAASAAAAAAWRAAAAADAAAADAAADAADAADAAWRADADAVDAARKNAYDKYADELLRLLVEAE